MYRQAAETGTASVVTRLMFRQGYGTIRVLLDKLMGIFVGYTPSKTTLTVVFHKVSSILSSRTRTLSVLPNEPLAQAPHSDWPAYAYCENPINRRGLLESDLSESMR